MIEKTFAESIAKRFSEAARDNFFSFVAEKKAYVVLNTAAEPAVKEMWENQEIIFVIFVRKQKRKTTNICTKSTKNQPFSLLVRMMEIDFLSIYSGISEIKCTIYCVPMKIVKKW